MARPRQPLLSRDRITGAALRIVDEEGLQALSTRRLAAVLGVTGPSLYNHFRTMDALVDALVDQVVGQVDLSMFGRLDWRTALRDWARSYRAALAGHPNLVPALMRPSAHRPHSLRLADAVFGGLVAAGWPRAHATHIGASMRYFITGSALGSFAAGFPTDAELYAGTYPHLDQAHLLAQHQRSVDEGAFETGLEALLEGLEAQYARVVGTAENPRSGAAQ
ncbi:TetR/AcrR family transcriptional regulator [Streptomyces sp. CA-132043]|uniref:TetR/AcrR family transcriptional regulator n=1 Tax=Streptomyces sp. CA-132043 TaxID=3240048 RepID=UPI003D8F473D